MPIRVILDTDIGTDVDDCLALAFLLSSPEIQLDAVTCVYGDVTLRARMARKLLRLRGREDVAVSLGVEKPLLGRVPVYWGGHEGIGLLDASDEAPLPLVEPAVDYIVRHVLANPGQIHLVAIGPLTNVALAFLREPRLAKSLGHLTIMGGACRGPGLLDLPYVEHNIKCDPDAAQVVFTSGAPITLVPLDVTTRVKIRSEDTAAVRQAGTPFRAAVAEQVEVYPPFKARGWTHLHDPLAAASLVRPDLLGFESLHVDVELCGQHVTGATLMRQPTTEAPANARVALTVQSDEFERFFVGRLAGTS
jgi:purine nucleosidase